MSDRTSINGTIDDVASLFRVSVRTVQDWKKERIIRAWSEGRNVIFDEEAVLDMYETRCTWLGLTDATTVQNQATEPTASGNFAAFRYSTSLGDTKWQCVCQDGS